MFTSCKESDAVRSYIIPKDNYSIKAEQGEGGGQPHFRVGPPEPAWNVPAGWTEQAPGPMILSRFRAAAGSDVTVTMFPGDVGGLFANVNRWRGQIGLSPISESELTSFVSPLDVNGMTAIVIDMTNDQSAGEKKTPNRLVAVVLQQNGQSWFHKMIGEKDAVGADKAAFLNFVQSMRLPNA